VKKEFRGKLRRAFKVGADEPHVTRDAAPYGRCADVLRRHHERSRRGLPEVELPEGREIVDGSGRYWVRRLEYALTDVHGAHALDAPHRADWERIAELAKLPELAAGPGDCLFLDTETTGLSGGAGTVVFLCGLGFFERDVLVLEQVFLRAFAEEPAALAHVARRMVEHPALVTFVGKSFDRHRLAARMTLHKIESPVLTDRHLDLYYMARRAWGKDLPDVRLRTVEEWKLGLRRVDDMPGAEAPYAFLSWVRDRTGRVDRVFEHNRLDVLSLVTLLGVLGEQ
jgi:uncharacterized protein YprB with RNaseH-like and TPR domain